MLDKIKKSDYYELDKTDLLENLYKLWFNLDLLDIVFKDHTLTFYEYSFQEWLPTWIYDHIENKIYIAQNNSWNTSTLLHEVLHYLMFTCEDVQKVTDLIFCRMILEVFKTKKRLLEEIRSITSGNSIKEEFSSMLLDTFFLQFEDKSKVQVENTIKLFERDLKLRKLEIVRLPSRYLDIVDLYKQEAICYFIELLFERDSFLLSQLEEDLFLYFK